MKYRPRKRSAEKENRVAYDPLESRQLLATINWVNPPNTAQGFYSAFGGENIPVVNSIIGHAIDTWEGYISNFNYNNVGTAGNAPQANTFNISMTMVDFTNPDVVAGVLAQEVDSEGKPYEAAIAMDINAAGAGWYLDQNVLGDDEFNQIDDAFSAGMFSGNADATKMDFYTTVLEQIGRAIAFGNSGFSGSTDLMSLEGQEVGTRRLISDQALSVINPAAPNGLGLGYTLSSQIATDNLYVHQVGSQLVIHGTGGADDISMWANSGQNVVRVNGFIERTAKSDFNTYSFKTWGSNDIVTINRQPNYDIKTGNVDLGTGTNDILQYITQNDITYAEGNGLKNGPNANNFMTFAGAETLRLRGGSGGEQFFVKNHDANLTQVYGEGGADFITAENANEQLQAWGGAGNDSIIGGNLADTLRGGDGDDSLRGGLGNDLLYGNAGADQYFFEGTNGNDHLAAYRQNGRIIGRRSQGSYTSQILELDQFFSDSSDFLTIDGLGGNDTMKAATNLGNFLDGRLKGGSGFDTVDFLPSTWDEIETEG